MNHRLGKMFYYQMPQATKRKLKGDCILGKSSELDTVTHILQIWWISLLHNLWYALEVKRSEAKVKTWQRILKLQERSHKMSASGAVDLVIVVVVVVNVAAAADVANYVVVVKKLRFW